jgi:hypothetical protein
LANHTQCFAGILRAVTFVKDLRDAATLETPARRESIEMLHGSVPFDVGYRRLKEPLKMSTVEKIYQEAIALPPNDLRRLIDMLSHVEAPGSPMTEEDFQKRLLHEGIISRLPVPVAERKPLEGFRPIKVEGKPLSEVIIEERR